MAKGAPLVKVARRLAPLAATQLVPLDGSCLRYVKPVTPGAVAEAATHVPTRGHLHDQKLNLDEVCQLEPKWLRYQCFYYGTR